MAMNDPLANALSSILNDEKIGKHESMASPSSKVIRKVLGVMRDSGYIGSFEETKNGRGDLIKINLLGNINKCGVVKPRYSVKTTQFEKFEKRYLLARGMGILILSTPAGIMSHDDAKKKQIGGKLLAYCY
ncbi:30S ribosomal protein S8 [Candidatus Woesearchaeota archaeon]|nr:30S ribosomal protein S8 [Candidatus Woesearchaeota archaeon]